MKNTFFALLIASMIVSCSNDDDVSSDDSSLTINNVSEQMIGGSWRISSYIDSGEDETQDYNGYTFEFLSDFTLRATNNTAVLDGVWNVRSSSSNDDSDPELDFIIYFAVPEDHPFDDLNEDWDIVNSTPTTLTLNDVSGGDGSVDNLVFSKN